MTEEEAVSRVRQRKLLAFITTLARSGLRMPGNDDLRRSGHKAVRWTLEALREAGLIEIRIYGRNWRVIELLTEDGYLSGQATAMPHAFDASRRAVVRGGKRVWEDCEK